ncbi:hypothetical protein BJ875DRAFT_483339 [Amylocarpus encephaloides]|uniref:Zn(2)-C6 fungal-type domain-containing protein n=1 Tax=Amylocarpus encephaloides TaxID=45428 RepID=A0A9P7YKL4_9HELO|nr:hypothetical protein BJ875DRAFT_483339 [Amylocarpus encephaloides]
MAHHQKSFESPTGPSPKKPYKIRVSRACTRCRKDKQPCVQDGENYIHGVTPCGRCKHLDFGCIITASKRRGPGPKQPQTLQIFDDKGVLVVKAHCPNGLTITELRPDYEAKVMHLERNNTTAPVASAASASASSGLNPYILSQFQAPPSTSAAGVRLNPFLDPYTGCVPNPALTSQAGFATITKRKLGEEVMTSLAETPQQMSPVSQSVGGPSHHNLLPRHFPLDEELHNIKRTRTEDGTSSIRTDSYLSTASQNSSTILDASSSLLNVDPRLFTHYEELYNTGIATTSSSSSGLPPLHPYSTLSNGRNLNPSAQSFVPAPAALPPASASGDSANFVQPVTQFAPAQTPGSAGPTLQHYPETHNFPFSAVPFALREGEPTMTSNGSEQHSASTSSNTPPLHFANFQPRQNSLAPVNSPILSYAPRSNDSYLSKVIHDSTDVEHAP